MGMGARSVGRSGVKEDTKTMVHRGYFPNYLCGPCLHTAVLMSRYYACMQVASATRLLLRFSLTGCSCLFFFCTRRTTRAARAPPAAASLTAPRLLLSPAASSRLPPATQTCPQVNDGPGATEATLPPCSENDHLGSAWPQWVGGREVEEGQD